MIRKKRILLLSQDTGRSMKLAGPLRVAGYEVTIREEFDDAVQLSFFLENTPQRFDLLVAVAAPGEIARLHAIRRLFAIDRLLVVRKNPDCRESYRIQGIVGFVCHPASLKVAAEELFKVKKGATVEEQLRVMTGSCFNAITTRKASNYCKSTSF